MAKLTVLDNFEGPGEELTAYYLKKHLPDSWHVIHGRQLPNVNRTQIDFFILAENNLFVVEEKYWGPVIGIGEVTWTVVSPNKLDPRPAPTIQASQNAKKTAGWLRNTFEIESMTVLDSVIISYENVDIRINPNSERPKNANLLQGCEHYYIDLDKTTNPKFQSARKKIEERLLGLSPGQSELTAIGDYRIKSEIPEATAGVRTFRAVNIHSDDEVVLECFDSTFWNSDPKQRNSFINREGAVFRKLATLNCTWVVYPNFFFETKQWWVVPTLKPLNFVPLEEFSLEEIQDGDPVKFREMLRQSLLTLKDVHGVEIIHKNLNPSTIWVGPTSKVLFNNFRFAHLDGLKSVNPTYTGEDRPKYLAPEVNDVDFSSNEKSDIFSLAASFCFCIFGEWQVPSEVPTEFSNLATVLSRMLDQSPESRIGISEALEKIEQLDTPATQVDEPIESNLSNEFAVGTIISARYKILEKLGAGGTGVSWLAEDHQSGKLKVLKALHNSGLYNLALKEYQATVALQGVSHCSTPRESNELPAPGYLVYDFVPGRTLEEFCKQPDIDIAKAKSLFVKAVKKLGEVHSRRIVHGDLSPRNLLIDEQENLWLIDFGLVANEGANHPGGTPATVSPERFRGDPIQVQSDIYSLCASFVIAILKRPPYLGDQSRPSNRNWALRPISDMEKRQWGDEASDFLNVLIMNCDEDVAKRAGSAEQLYEQIEAIRVPRVQDWPVLDAERLINPTVAKLRTLYIRSKDGASGALGIDSEFAKDTYSPTALDTELIPDVLSGDKRLIFLTGNAGDGKTSFLQTLREKLMQSQAERLVDDAYGWSLRINDRVITALNDASESRGEVSRDDVLIEKLDKYIKSSETVLIAINDGRMHEFFEEHTQEYPAIRDLVQDFFKDGVSDKGDMAIVDLKNRSLVTGGEESIFDSIVSQLVSPQRWETCNECAVVNQCPIFSNASQIADSAKQPVKNLFEITHLKRNKRVTLRQMRSTLSWLISGDLDCKDVHTAADEGTNLKRKGFSLSELAFSTNTTDPLVEAWRKIDPANLNSSVMNKHLEENAYDNMGFSQVEIYSRGMRQALFKQPLENHNGPWLPPESETQGYIYIAQFLDTLNDPSRADLGLILRGISRLMSPIFYLGGDLLLAKRAEGKWMPLRKFEASEFVVTAFFPKSKYIETQPEYLSLVHEQSSRSLIINLDAFEVLMRCAQGQLMSDVESDAIRHEVQRFTNSLVGNPISSILLVEPSGRQNPISLDQGIIAMIADRED